MTGSLMLKSPGAALSSAILLEALYLLNRNVAIIRQIVLTEPPSRPKLLTSGEHRILG